MRVSYCRDELRTNGAWRTYTLAMVRSRTGWTFVARSLAAVALVACLFLPLSTCTHRGETHVKIPVHDIEPLAEVLLVFCWPVLLLVAEALRPRLSTSGIWLVALQPPLAAGTYFQMGLYTLLETPAIGSYLADAALAVIFMTALLEATARVQERVKMRRAAAGSGVRQQSET